MNSCSRQREVVFFEGGYQGGSVNRLLTILDNWNNQNIRPSLVAVFSEVLAKRLLIHPTLDAATSLNWPVRSATDPFMILGLSRIPTMYFVKYYWATLKFLLRHKNAVVYFNNTPHMHIPSILCAILMKRKIICHLRDTISLTKGELFVSKWINCFIVLSRQASEHYRRQLRKDVRIEVVYNAVDIFKYGQLNGGSITRKCGSVAVCIGTLSHRKGQDLCLKALSIVLKSFPSASLYFVGSGETENMLREMARKLNIEDSVYFMGHVDDVTAILSEASIGLLASRREGFPNSILEYMAAKLPVIVSDLSGISELVVDGLTGFIIPQEDVSALADKWMCLLANEEVRNRFGERGREVVEKSDFSLNTEICRIVSIIESVV